MKVFKFGGASIKDAPSIKNILEIISKYKKDNLVIVVSAMGKTTNALEKVVDSYFNAQPKNSFISVEGAAKKIQAKLPDKIIISETIIYNRLKDPKFNKNNLKPQTLDNQVSKTAPYKVKITDELKNKMKQLREPGIYLYLEVTQSGNNTLRLKLNGELFENSDTSYPPNLNSLKLIEQKIKDSRK